MPIKPQRLSGNVPLTKAKVRLAFDQRSLYDISGIRQAAAVLDACAQPMRLENLETYLSDLTPHRHHLNADDVRIWNKPFLHLDAHDRLWLVGFGAEVATIRQAVRKLARTVDKRKTVGTCRPRTAGGFRRAVLRILPDHGSPVAAALLDVDAHAAETFVGEELAGLSATIEQFDLVAALRVHEALAALGVPESGFSRLVDLQPPCRTITLNRQGRLLEINPDLLISSTTGIRRPLGDPAKVSICLARDDDHQLRRRVASDAQALYNLYRYGVFQGCVRLRWGFVNESFPVDWAIPGDLHVNDVIDECHAAGKQVDIVWARRHPGMILGCGHDASQSSPRIRSLSWWKAIAGVGGLRAAMSRPFVRQNEAEAECLRHFDADASVIDLLRPAHQVHVIPLQ